MKAEVGEGLKRPRAEIKMAVTMKSDRQHDTRRKRAQKWAWDSREHSIGQLSRARG